MTTAIVITIPAWPPAGLRANMRQRTHWAKRRRLAQDWLYQVRAALETIWGDLPETPWHRAHAHVLFLFPDDRRRDVENFASGLKEVWDYLIRVGLLADDHWRNLSFTLEGRQDKAHAPATIITLTRGDTYASPRLPL